ncbi:MAG: aminoacyl-tRNA hydrolase [Arsenophonus sp.]|nr:MAG: aminoacyl-tRNA hydrolase [Arsenophonus sp.]
MNKIKLIVGLGNPEKKYFLTRHNIGYWYLNLLMRNYNIISKKKYPLGYIHQIMIENNKVFLLFPKTYINLSGLSVSYIKDIYSIKNNEILIAYDDLTLPIGRAKIKFGNTYVTHNGIRNIEDVLKNNNFYRLRIGIGHPGKKQNVTRFLLNIPSIRERKIINYCINKIVLATKFFFSEGPNKAINYLHNLK